MPNGKTTKKKQPGRPRLSANLNLLMVSFGIAFVVWVFAKTAQTEESRLGVPVNVTPRDPRVEVLVTPDHLPVLLRYPRELQRDISSENFRFEVDARDLRDNLGIEWKTKTQALGRENLVSNLPRTGRVDFLRIDSPNNTVEVKMRWNAQPAVVEADVAGADRLPAGFQLVTPVKVTPREVYVAGEPASLARAPRDPVSGRIRLMTDTVSVQDRTRGGTEQVAIRVPQGLEVVQPATILAEVALEVQEVQTVREIRGVPLEFKAVSADTISLDYKERTAAVTVYGPQSLLPKLDPSSFEVVMQRPPEELPGTTKDVPLEARIAKTVPEEIRSRLTVRTIEPRVLRIRYVARQQPAPATPQ